MQYEREVDLMNSRLRLLRLELLERLLRQVMFLRGCVGAGLESPSKNLGYWGTETVDPHRFTSTPRGERVTSGFGLIREQPAGLQIPGEVTF